MDTELEARKTTVPTKSQRAFEILCRENTRMLMVYLRSFLRNEATVDDLFQETLIVAWRRLDRCDLDRPFGPWLRGIARILVKEHFRKEKRSPILLDDSIVNAIDYHFEHIRSLAGDTWDQKLEALQFCLEALPRQHKEVIEGRYNNKMKVKGLAEDLAISVEACKKRLQRARAMIADCLKRKGLLGELEGTS
ncbi:MAG TPA: RNA polymerase factor sigma-70 [Rhodobacteraceae bacterium]|nr:RNA polymerase factor sigma-70 [Paracoccaceae bacterium]